MGIGFFLLDAEFEFMFIWGFWVKVEVEGSGRA